MASKVKCCNCKNLQPTSSPIYPYNCIIYAALLQQSETRELTNCEEYKGK